MKTKLSLTTANLKWTIVPVDRVGTPPDFAARKPAPPHTLNRARLKIAGAAYSPDEFLQSQQPQPVTAQSGTVKEVTAFPEKTRSLEDAGKTISTRQTSDLQQSGIAVPQDAGQITVAGNVAADEALSLEPEAEPLAKMNAHSIEQHLVYLQVSKEREEKHKQGYGILPVEVEKERRENIDRRMILKHGRRTVDKIPFTQNRLSVYGLKKNFGRKQVVKGVGFYICGGDVAGLLGPNGAGKTTIFYMIVGFLHPTEGSVILNEHDITTGPMYKRARLGIAYLPQEASIFRKLTVEQNIAAVLETRNDITKQEKKQKLDELVSDFNIERIRKQPGYTLSGGERRRTEIARALAIEPKFLLLDEPFAGIDPIAVFDIKEIIRKLASRGIGVLITDHNVRDTLEITNDAFIIADGNIVARGTKDMILNNEMVREIYLGNDFKM